MLKYLLIFILLAVGANAADYNILVTNDDNVEILTIILDGVNYFFGIENTVNEGALRYQSMVKFVLVIGTVWALIQLTMASMSGNSAAGLKHYFMYLFMVFVVALLIYGPRSSILIQTPNNTQYAISEDVPFLFAFTLSMFTTLQYELSDITESAFNVPDASDNFLSGGSGGLGYFGGQIMLSKSSRFATFSAGNNNNLLSNKYSAFTRDCVILPELAKTTSLLNDVMHSNNIKGNISPVLLGNTTELITYNGVTGTCGDFWSGSPTMYGAGFINLEDSINSFENNVTNTSNLGKVGSALAYFGALMDNTTAISNAAAVKEQATQAVLSNEFRSVFAKMGIAGEVSADGAAQTMAEMQLTGISTGLFVAEQLPRAGFLLFALMVSATPFLLAFAMFPGSSSILINFIRTLLWISLWEPMGNILGIFQDYHFSKILTENGYTTLNNIVSMTPDNLVNISSEAAALAGIAGGMFVAIQGLSWMLITGSGQMIGNLMSSSAASFQRLASPDTQMETRTDMQEAALMSKELGRSVSLREKYAFNSAIKAGVNSGTTAGYMGSHGDTPGAASSISRAVNMATVVKQSASIGAADVLKTATTASNVGRTLSEQKTQTDMQASGNLNNMSVHEKNNVAKLHANKHALQDSKTINKTANHNGTSGKDAVEAITNTNALKATADVIGTINEVAASGGEPSHFENTASIAQDRGSYNKAVANRIQKELARDPNSLDDKNKLKSEVTVGADFERSKHRNEITSNFSKLHDKKTQLDGQLDAVQTRLRQDSENFLKSDKTLTGDEMKRHEADIKKESSLINTLNGMRDTYNVAKMAFDGVTNQDTTIGQMQNVQTSEQQGKLSADSNITANANKSGQITQSKTVGYHNALPNDGESIREVMQRTGEMQGTRDMGDQKAAAFQALTKTERFLNNFAEEDRSRAMEVLEDFGYIRGGDAAVNSTAVDKVSDAMKYSVNSNGYESTGITDVYGDTITLKANSQNDIRVGTKTDVGSPITGGVIEGWEAATGRNFENDVSGDNLKYVAAAGAVSNFAEKFAQGFAVKSAVKRFTNSAKSTKSGPSDPTDGLGPNSMDFTEQFHNARRGGGNEKYPLN